MGEPKFKVGDIVTVLGNTNDDEHEVGYCDYDMDAMVGDIYIVSEVCDGLDCEAQGVWMYKLEGDDLDYWYDEEWLDIGSSVDSESQDIEDFFDEYK